MIPAPLPPDEDRRHAALSALHVLDSKSDPELDALVERAARLLDAPIALVSLVDADRQWFLSRYGLDASETPRDVSFCGHAILRDGALVVPDATRDERFHDNPLVTGGPRVVSYAGAPLTLLDGSAVGTLCVIDHGPRQHSADEIELLYVLRDAVVDRLVALAAERGPAR